MKIPLSLLDLAIAASAFSGTLRTQTGSGYPSKTKRVVATFPLGSGADSIARLFGPSIHERLGQPLIVDNRSGAGKIIRGELVDKALTDGQGHCRISDRPSAKGAGRYPIAFKIFDMNLNRRYPPKQQQAIFSLRMERNRQEAMPVHRFVDMWEI